MSKNPDQIITVNGALEDGASVGVTMARDTGTFTIGWINKMDRTAKPADYFFSDLAPQYGVRLDSDNEAELYIPAIAPSITGVTSLTDTNALTYGSTSSISVSATAPTGHSISGYQWYDNGTTNSNSGGTKIENAAGSSYTIHTNKDVGTYYYYCVVTSKRSDNNATATATSGVATVTVNRGIAASSDFTYTPPTELMFDGNPKEATVATKSDVKGMGTVTVKYFSDAARTTEATPMNVDTYYVGIAVAEGDNYNATSSVLYGSDWDFTITANTTANAVQKLDETLTYTGSALPPTLVVTDTNQNTLAANTDFTATYTGRNNTAYASSSTAPADAGDYTANVTFLGNYSGSQAQNVEYTIQPATLSDVSVAQSGTLTYTGEPLTPTVSEQATAVNSQRVTFSYSTTQDGIYGAMPTFTDATTGTTVYYQAAAPNHSEASGSFQVVVGKATIHPTVTITGWTCGSYNAQTNAPQLGENSNPGGSQVTYTFCTDENCTTQTTAANSGAETDGGVPKNIGTYWVRATIPETANYLGGTAKASFTIRQHSTPDAPEKPRMKKVTGTTIVVNARPGEEYSLDG